MLKKFKRKQNELAQIHINKAKTGNILAIYKLFNRYYIKSFFGPFFNFAFPVLIYGILGTLMDYKIMFAGVAAMTCLSGLSSMPMSIVELKKSVLMKRIGASPVKTSKFTFVIVSYFVITIFISILWLMLWALIFHQNPSMFDYLSTAVGFFSFFYGIILTTILSISIGFLISTISKSESQAQAISMLIMFPSQFLSGMFITIDIIASNEVMNWISRLIPYRYTTMYLVSSAQGLDPFIYHDLIGHVSMTPNEIFDMGKAGEQKPEFFSKSVTFFASWETIMAYIYPLFFISISTMFTIKKFTWSSNR